MSLPVKMFWMLVGIGAVLIVLHLTLQHLNLAYNEKHGQIFEISNRFDVDDEASVPTWFSQAIWMGVALSSILAARLSGVKSARKLWLIMSAIGIFFSIDEVSGIHELSLQSLHLLFFGLQQSSSSLNAWWLVMPLVIVFGAWFLKKLHSVLGIKQWTLIMGGWLIFLIGAVGLELYGNDVPHNTFYYQGIVTGVEEGLEILGAIVIFYVILSYLDIYHRTQVRRIWKELRPKNS